MKLASMRRLLSRALALALLTALGSIAALTCVVLGSTRGRSGFRVRWLVSLLFLFAFGLGS
jgi:hypothetical protein